MEVGEEGEIYTYRYTVTTRYIPIATLSPPVIVQELCESQGGHPGLSVITSLLVSVDVKIY